MNISIIIIALWFVALFLHKMAVFYAKKAQKNGELSLKDQFGEALGLFAFVIISIAVLINVIVMIF